MSARTKRVNVCISATFNRSASFFSDVSLDFEPDEMEILHIGFGDDSKGGIRVIYCSLVDNIIGYVSETKVINPRLTFNLPRPTIKNTRIKFDFMELDNTPSKETGEIVIFMEFRKFIDRTTAII
jgi:hypothetical protein